MAAFTLEERRELNSYMKILRGPEGDRSDPSSPIPSSPESSRKRRHGASSNSGPPRTAKKFKRWTETKIEPKVKEAIGDALIQKSYASLPDTYNYDDDIMFRYFKDLFEDMCAFTEKYFGAHDLGKKQEPKSHWPDMSREFVEYAAIVAEGDPAFGGWEEFLTDRIHRKWLVMAVMVRIFEMHIFADLLFGGNDREKDLLLGLDKCLFNTSEGFTRNALRARTVRTLLATRSTTENFYHDVGKLTEQISIVLKPLTDKICDSTLVGGFSQQLHNIVSDCAYISIAIRTSSNIVYLAEVRPGSTFDRDDHICIEIDLYKKRKALLQRKLLEQQDEASRRETKKEVQAARWKKPQSAAEDSEDSNESEESEPLEPPVYHRALTKIGVWPNIRIYKPGSGKPNGKNDGFRQLDLGTAAVVCYFGPTDGMKEPTLKEVAGIDEDSVSKRSE